ncbi:c-type cytochrome [Microvirga lotononidis]|uniref:Cytochrome c n=1 Tax=Microvirga lotononidis TaxID=864069 RepID=I4YVS7_9HYPH|nr:cytochrome c [Microvirga lotononidis]EIM28069.1 cytochrome c [Microvirga lotononidis]WQO27822.1 cytochrome c [Microvirga lotononidis]
MRLALVLLATGLLAACDSGTEERDGVASTRAVQRPYTAVPPGVVPQGTAARKAALAAPGPEVTRELLARGEERFRAFCVPCHGESGRGDGTIVSRGFPPPPSYHEERLISLAPEQIVQVITHGKGRMYPYADRVLPEERWAIAHYVKDLQARGTGSSSDQGTVRP